MAERSATLVQAKGASQKAPWFEAIRWRWWFLRRYWFLVRSFRNGFSLARAYRQKQSCATAVLRDGTIISHPPGRAGLIPTILEIWQERSYAPPWFYRPANGDVVIDAGANVGLFSIWIARQAPQCRIVALEPFEENFGYLQKNLSAVRLQHVTAYQAALGAHSGWGRMVAQEARSLDHQLVTDGAAPSGEPRVPILSLPDLIERIGVQRITFLKVDIEGAESAVFGSLEPGWMNRVDRVAIEYHEHLSPGVCNMLVQKLQPTHSLVRNPEPGGKCGILLGQRRAL
jgi:FkbM family methyltransferase